MPSMRPNIRVAAVITAPVFPAETNASASPFFTSFMPTAMDESRLSRMTSLGWSLITTTWLASTMGKLQRYFLNSASMASLLPTSTISFIFSLAAATAPSTSAIGECSLPIASRAIFMQVYPLLPTGCIARPIGRETFRREIPGISHTARCTLCIRTLHCCRPQG